MIDYILFWFAKALTELAVGLAFALVVVIVIFAYIKYMDYKYSRKRNK